MALAYHRFKQVGDRFIIMFHHQDGGILGVELFFPLLLFLLLHNLLQLHGEVVLQILLGDFLQDQFYHADEVLVHEAEEVLHLAQLDVVGFEDLGGAGEVVDDRDGQDLEHHHLLDLAFRVLVFIRSLELRNDVVIFVGELPPVTAQLADNDSVVLFQGIR